MQAIALAVFGGLLSSLVVTAAWATTALASMAALLVLCLFLRAVVPGRRRTRSSRRGRPARPSLRSADR